ncbi:MAG: hypothetical protein KAQ83_03030 [Nanoarchaeota archaeon]|nr:hypothetical protein [Nanoarchaeota archaeon]
MKNEKQDHMALVAIVGIVAIVGLFLMFTGNGNDSAVVSEETSENMAGQAIRVGITSEKKGIENNYESKTSDLNSVEIIQVIRNSNLEKDNQDELTRFVETQAAINPAIAWEWGIDPADGSFWICIGGWCWNGPGNY